MLFILCHLFLLDGPARDYGILQRYAPLPSQSNEILQLPFSMDFSSDGSLYLLDTVALRVHVWDKQGVYRFSFGQKGPGPGELQKSAWLQLMKQQVWVWGWNRSLLKFDLHGQFLEVSRPEIRFDNFVPLGPERILATFKNHATPQQTFASFRLTDDTGKVLETLEEIPHRAYLTPPGGKLNLIKAFGPDQVIQPGEDGLFYYGFSQDNSLRLINSKGELVARRRFDLPIEKPTEEEIALVKGLCYPRRTGGTRCLADANNLKFDFNQDKAFYTHFLIRGKRIAFVLTPIGGMRSGMGFRHASFRVNDLATGKALERGVYDFPEGSVVLHQRGRSVAFVSDEQGDYQIQEILLKGLE